MGAIKSQTLLIFLKAPVPGKVKTRLAKGIGARAAAEAYRWMARRIRSEVERLRNVRIVWVYEPAPKFPDLSWLNSGDTHLIRSVGTRKSEFGERPRIWKQASGDLGRRLRLATSRAFRRYGGPVCVIGTDSPALKAARLRAAFAALRNKDIVLGPAEDGGYYLIGMYRFHPEVLNDISWSTERVLRQTLEAAEKFRLQVRLLPKELDIDDAAGWKRWKKGEILRGGLVRPI